MQIPPYARGFQGAAHTSKGQVAPYCFNGSSGKRLQREVAAHFSDDHPRFQTADGGIPTDFLDHHLHGIRQDQPAICGSFDLHAPIHFINL